MFKVRVIGSGSKGNATVIFNEDTTLLIDFGLSRLRVKKALKDFDKTLESIDYAFFTHNHTDHIKSLQYLEPNKVYALDGTVPLKQKNKLEPYTRYKFGSFFVTPISTSHDAPNPTGYLIEDEDTSLVYMTDTGYIPEKSLAYMINKDYYIIESNHDILMLLQSNRSNELKYRILAYFGHLSNEQSALYMSNLVGDKTKKIVLAHLSEECNDPDIALDTYDRIFREQNVQGKFDIVCANQKEPIDL